MLYLVLLYLLLVIFILLLCLSPTKLNCIWKVHDKQEWNIYFDNLFIHSCIVSYQEKAFIGYYDKLFAIK